MDTQKIEVRFEDFVSRIPGLFAYLEWNEDGTVSTHPATDSPNGCYGKVVENIFIPNGVRLINYSQINESEIPSSYQWGDGNTISLSENAKHVFSVSAALYLRQVQWYWYEKTSTQSEAAVFVDTIPTYVDDDSPSSIKIYLIGPDGEYVNCYGIPLYEYYVKKTNYTFFRREDIIKPCTTYSYRDIIENYYYYKDIVGSDNSFIKFVNTGIGLIKTDKRLLNLTDEQKYSEVPEEFYLSQVRTILHEYRELQAAHNHYVNHYVANGKTDSTLIEKSRKYIRMGGDNMTNWLTQQIQKLYDIASEYKCHSDNKDFPLRINTNLMLEKSANIVGLETVFTNEFVPGNKYYDGDLLTYNGRTYICKLDRFVNGGDNYEYILKSNKTLYVVDNTMGRYVRITNENISYLYVNEQIPIVKTSEFVICDGVYYRWNDELNNYVIIDVVEYVTGVWDEVSERYVFDEQHFVLLSDIDTWYDDNNLNGEKYRFFNNTEYLPSTHIADYVRYNDTVFEWDDVSEQFVPASDESYIIKERTNSKLRDLRVFREYMNPFGKAEEPGANEDWLYYYKINKVTGLVVETDDFGNILRDGEDYVSVGENVYDLHAYGNIITNIEYNSSENTITFEYVINAHLIGEYDGCEPDNDGNLIYYYKNFEYDTVSGDGVYFKESYICLGDDIRNLGSDFEAYINGDLNVMLSYAFEKFPFVTVPSEMLDGTMSIVSQGTALIPAYADILHSPTVREEWMNGLYIQPKVKSGVLIDRGNGASFEKHLRLGEIHTMEDFENYQNGGFFKISEN